MTSSNLRLNVSRSFATMATNLPFCFSIFRTIPDVSSKLILKYVKCQRKHGFLIKKELIFGYQILDLKDHFSASRVCTERMMDHQYRENDARIAFKLYHESLC